jgi:trans-2-enoyl-CoA reductase
MKTIFKRRNLNLNLSNLIKSIHSYQVSELKLHEYGNIESGLKLETRQLNDEEVQLKQDEVFVKLVAAPINPADINIIQGKYAFLPNKLPSVIGNEGLFEIVKVNENNKRLKAGDWVLPVQLGWGTWRSHSIEKEKNFLKIPNNLDRNACATLVVNPCTAFRLLHNFVDLKENDTVIQNGANSAVGQAVIQLAKIMNLNLINIVRKRDTSDKQEELNSYLRSLGANYIFTEEDLRKSQQLNNGLWKQIPKPKLAFNCVGGKATTDMVRLLGNDSIVVTYGGMSRQPLIFNTADFIFKNLKCVGFWLTAWRSKNESNFEQTIHKLCDLIQQNKFKAPRCVEFKLENYLEALKQAQTPFTNSKVLLVN